MLQNASDSKSFGRAAALEAKAAGLALQAAPATVRSAILRELAAALMRREVRQGVLAANRLDCENGRHDEVAGRLPMALLKRLLLDEKKLDGLVQGVSQLAAMEAADLGGRVMVERELDEGLVLTRQACPLGLLAVVFESRPDALVQIASLAIRSGNAALLKGGREALATNRVLTAVIQDVLRTCGLPPEAILLLEERAEVKTLLGLDGLVDLVIARGSTAFVEEVRSSTRIPVMGHAAGLCHLYLHASAPPAMAAALAVDGKCSYPAACNATETLLWEPGAEAALDAVIEAMAAADVELRGDAATRARHPVIVAASDADWDTEHGTLVLNVKRVSGIGEALAHIARHGTRHTEAIVASDGDAAAHFLAAVDAACVFHNASTRFSDGFRFGLGAEVGINTDKLHARGPVGLDGLYTYRWLLRGHGQVTAAYGPSGRPFRHRNLR